MPALVGSRLCIMKCTCSNIGIRDALVAFYPFMDKNESPESAVPNWESPFLGINPFRPIGVIWLTSKYSWPYGSNPPF